MKESTKEFLDFYFENPEPPLKSDDKGKVYKAKDKSNGEFVIIKIIDNSAACVYQLLKKNPSPLYPEIIYFAEDKGNADAVIVYRFIDGETLEGKKFNESDARKILLQMCDALEFLHALNIVYSDVKPANIILQKNKKIRLIDFDAARIYREGKTLQTTYLGTEKYASPEQIAAQTQIDFRSDIYNLGKTFLEVTNCGARLKKILLKCAADSPENRYQNIGELRNALLQKKFTALKICAIIFIFMAVILFHNSTSEENFAEFNLKLGGLTLGDSLEKMRETLGREDRVTPSKTPDHIHCEYKKIVITFNKDKICALVSYTDEIQTESGIRQGDSLEKVIAAYGRRCSVINQGEEIFYEYPYQSEGGNFAVIRFAVKGGRVEYISLRTVEDFKERDWILANVRTI